jgi:beta-galactosidase
MMIKGDNMFIQNQIVLVLLVLLFAFSGMVNAKLIITPEEKVKYIKEEIVSPRYWDMYYQKKDRIYLDGIWKLKWGKNVLTEEFITDNIIKAKVAKGMGMKLKEGVSIRYKDFNNDKGLVKKYYTAEYNDSTWMDILVPRSWSMVMPWEEGMERKDLARPYTRKKSYYFGGVGYYRKRFTIPANKTGMRCFMHFMNVDVVARVWVNGKLMTKKDNMNLSDDPAYRVTGAWMNFFEFEIPQEILVPGNNKNVVTVRVFSKGVPWYWHSPNPGGITAPVWLEFRNKIFAENINIVPRYRKKGIDLGFTLNGAAEINGTVIIEPWESEDYSFPGGKKVFNQKFSTTGGKFKKKISLPEIEEWTTGKPCLYSLKIVDSAGNTLGIERFGISVLETRNGKFYHNGRNIFLFGLNTHHSMFDFAGGGNPSEFSSRKQLMNHDNYGRKVLLLRKKAGFRYMRIHTGPAAPWCFSICDEVGLIASDEWSSFHGDSELLAADDPEKDVEYLFRKGYQEYTDKDGNLKDIHKRMFRKWLNSNKMNPSLLLFTGGNEPKAYTDVDFQNYARGLYNVINEYDIRKRLFSPASGCHVTLGGKSTLKEGDGDAKLPHGYWDFHNYGPQSKGSILMTRQWFLNHTINTVNRIFGRKDIAYINGETFLDSQQDRKPVSRRWDFTKAESRKTITQFFEKGFTERMQFLQGIHYGLGALFNYETATREKLLWLKKYIENIRYAVPEMQGYALHMPKNYWLKKIEKDKRSKDEWGSYDMEQFALAQAPVQVMVRGLHEVSVFPGEPTSQDLVIVNNAGNAYKGVKVNIMIDGAKAASIDVGDIAVEEIKKFKADFKVPGIGSTGRYKMKLELSIADSLISTNEYEVFILKRDFPLKSLKKACIIDDRKMTAQRIAKSLGLEVVEFNGKNSEKLLIVAPGVFTGDVNSKLDKWLKKGGMAFILEQKAGILNPWLEQKVSGRDNFEWPISSSAKPDSHVIMKDLYFRNYSYWRKGAVVFETFFPDITEDVLVAGHSGKYSFWKKDPPGFGMVAVGQTVEKGRYVWTQLKIADNFEIDSSAYCIMRNMLLHLTAKE